MYKIVNIGPLKLIHSSFFNFKTASLGVFLKTGARFEKKREKGIAHFLEHMLFKGTHRYSYKRIKREIEGKGGILNGFTSQEVTAYYAHFLKKNSLVVLDILLDMVLNPILSPQEVKKERGVILEEIKMYNDIPSSCAKTILDSLLWESHPLGQDIIGTEKTVQSITRKDLKNFKDKFYTPSNIVISFCGDFSLDKIRNFIEKKIGKKKKRKSIYQKKPTKLKGIKIKIEKKDTQQLQLCLGFRSVSYQSNKKIIQNLLHVLLGANMSSRLFESLREKRSLCYDISTEPKFFKDSGAFIIKLGLNKENLGIALAVIKKELIKIKSRQIGKTELTRAKDYFIGQISMSLEQAQGRMFYSAQNYIKTTKIESLDEIIKQVRAVDSRGINDFAKELFDFNNLAVSVVGNGEQVLAGQIKAVLAI
ncbi:MAG: insulinase family protein [Candidatus Omnitrophica bacterium]|nr:insulinase family protein [Candidatus Omnitrophota bacterium]MCF7877698.1 insulinase family protein [Candidatus Omnitrophota bacterium]MCF7878723.1 insulinase family protein [Candidatus Omnitrophota bacterium]MCF7892955.1 insulinase family protein [Candidatus Omnitrophota bacterium]